MESGDPKEVGGMSLRLSLLIALVLIMASWAHIFFVDQASLSELFSEENRQHGLQFIRQLIGLEDEHPAFLEGQSWKKALTLTFETLVMSIMAIGFATTAMLVTVVPAARNVAQGSLTLVRRWYNWLIFGLVRLCYIFSRAVPELIWAMIIIFIFNPGLLPGAIALALHNFGILGKLCAEVIEDLNLRPIRNLASSGASKAQIFIYGVIPEVLPKFITYILYRWEVIIRTTIVVGFVGAGGLGMEFKLSMSWFHYTEIALYLLCYVLLVFFVDLLSEGIRRAVKS